MFEIRNMIENATDKNRNRATFDSDTVEIYMESIRRITKQLKINKNSQKH